MKIFLYCFLIFCLPITLFSQERMIVRLSDLGEEEEKYLQIQYLDVAAFSPSVFLDLVVNKIEYEQLISEGYTVKIQQTETEIKENLNASSRSIGYQTYEVMLDRLNEIVNQYPEICRLEDIGDSQGKIYYLDGNYNYIEFQHDIWALKLSDNVSENEDEPYIYYMAEHHAREPIGLEVCMHVLEYLIANYGTDEDITNWIDNTQIWFIPLVNPDGHKIVLDQTDVWWRKNIRDNNENLAIDYSYNYLYPDGVDLNRNYSFEWGGTGSSGDAGEQVYKGLVAFSEPETIAVRDLMNTYPFVAGISFHSYGEYVLFSYGYDEERPAPDGFAMQALGNQMAATIPSVYGGQYYSGPMADMYPYAGNSEDYSYGQHCTFAYIFELGIEFIPPGDEIIGICEKTINASMILLDRVNHEVVTGLVTDAISGEPVSAQVFVNGVDDTGEFRYPYYSDTLNGRYYRLLLEDNYTITFSAEGYYDKTFEQIDIDIEDQTILNVQLDPINTGIEHPKQPSFSVYPNPASTGINIYLDENLVKGKMEIMDISGKEVKSFIIDKNSLHNISWDFTTNTGVRVKSGIYFIKLSTNSGSWSEKVVKTK